MIVRILGDGQYEIDDTLIEELNKLDAVVDKALGAGDEAAFQAALSTLTAVVRQNGKPVEPETILASDLVLPHEGASLAEVRQLLASEDV